MHRVELYTDESVGPYAGFVHADDIPPFQPPASVVMWGGRCFTYRSTERHPVTGQLTHRYIEAFAYFLP